MTVSRIEIESDSGKKKVLPPRFSIAGKGFILVAVPLIFELIVFGCLLKLLVDTEQDVQAEKHARLVFLETTTLTASLYDLGALLLSAKNSTSSDKTVAGILNHVEALESLGLTTVDAHESECIRRISLSFREMTQLFSEINESSDDSMTNLSVKQEALSIANALHEELQELSRFEGEVQKASSSSAQAQRDKLKVLLYLAIASSLVLAIGLSVYFTQNIKRRIEVIADNSRRLVLGEQLREEVGDKDEITDLDRAFHNMASALVRAQKKERALVDNARDVICSLDKENVFQRMNSACSEFWGYQPLDLIGTSIEKLVIAEDRDRTIETLSSARKGELVKPFENRLLSEDGTTRYALWTFQWSDSEGEMFCVAHDITDRRELEQLKEDFLAMISHELRTPLTSINAAMVMLADGKYGELTVKGQATTSRVLESSERLIRLINSLLDIEKLQIGPESLEMDEQPLEETLMNGLDAVKDLADKVNVRLTAQSTELYLTADHDRIMQVLVNLLSNAIKYSPPNSTVAVSVKEQEGDRVEIRVADEGAGIPVEYMESIFDRFQQVKGKRETTGAIKGTGLGLPLAKVIVEQHGGEIGVESEIGSGSVFWIRLPRARKLSNR